MSSASNVRSKPSFELEQKYDLAVCGIDEAGRGPLAGPVVAACVYVPNKVRDLHFIREINDSKKMTVKKRLSLFDDILSHCPHGIGKASADEVDSLNIHNATLLAMHRSFNAMHRANSLKNVHVLVDGKFVPDLPYTARAIKKGDSISVSIAAASIIAKVTRDKIMEELHDIYPYYGWNKNSAYGTAQHLDGIAKHGITEHHRRTFAPVRRHLESIQT